MYELGEIGEKAFNFYYLLVAVTCDILNYTDALKLINDVTIISLYCAL